MRFSCQVKVVNRACSGQHQPRSKRSTISIGGYGKTDSGSSLYILHQTPQDPAGVRYKVIPRIRITRARVNCRLLGIF